jgi:hypothetical protein
MGSAGGGFSSASGDLKALGAFFCNFATFAKPRLFREPLQGEIDHENVMMRRNIHIASHNSSCKNHVPGPILDRLTIARMRMESTMNATDQTNTETAVDATAARDFVLRAAKTAKEQAESLRNGAEKATSTLESTLNTSVATVADASRALQGALYKDVEATLAAVEKLASSKSLAEAAQVHVEFLNQRGQVGLERFKSATDYLANALQSASKTVQDNIAKMSERAAKAA